MKPVLIKQPKGLGDIFFCQKIACRLVERGHRVIWPVISKYIYVKDYLIGNVEFVDIESNFDFKDIYTLCEKGRILEHDNCIIISTDGCKETEEMSGVMIGKYNLVNLDHTDWKNYFQFKRCEQKEIALFHKLNLREDDEYVIINNNIGGPGDESSWLFDVPTDLKQIKICEYPGFTIFDWSKILENASAFYTMETCISYIIEKLFTKEREYIMYHRSPSSSPNCKEFVLIYKKPRKHVGCESIVRL